MVTLNERERERRATFSESLPSLDKLVQKHHVWPQRQSEKKEQETGLEAESQVERHKRQLKDTDVL